MTLDIPEPSEKQKLFLTATEKNICFGGARGGGKSWAVRVKAVLLCAQYPGIKCMIVRRTYPELRENHILPLCKMLHVGDKNGFATYNDQKKDINFVNGSRIIFKNLDHERDQLKFQGTEADVIFVDEATQQSEGNMNAIRACLRGVNNFPHRIYYTCNPGGEGHGWVKRLFIDRKFNEGEHPEEYVFIQSLVTDNPALLKQDPGYLDRLKSLPPRQRDAWLYGNWEIFEGQFFEDFRIEPDMIAAENAGCTLDKEELRRQGRWVHVIDPIDLEHGAARSWKIYRSYDFGYGKPFSCAWWAVDHDGVLYRIMELYGCKKDEPNEGLKWSPDTQAKEIAKIEREHPWLRGKQITGVADPAIWEASSGVSVAETMAKHGVYFTPGDHERIAGWMQLHYRFQFDEEGYPRIYIFSNCKGFIRTIPLMMYDEHKPEDLDTDLEDHVADEARYMCMMRPIAPMKKTERKIPLNDPLNQFSDLLGGNKWTR